MNLHFDRPDYYICKFLMEELTPESFLQLPEETEIISGKLMKCMKDLINSKKDICAENLWFQKKDIQIVSHYMHLQNYIDSFTLTY